jgi:hypothetical protein
VAACTGAGAPLAALTVASVLGVAAAADGVLVDALVDRLVDRLLDKIGDSTLDSDKAGSFWGNEQGARKMGGHGRSEGPAATSAATYLTGVRGARKALNRYKRKHL